MRRRVGSGLLHRSAVRAMERSVVHGGRLVHRRSVTASPETMNPRMTLPAHRPQEMQNIRVLPEWQSTKRGYPRGPESTSLMR